MAITVPDTSVALVGAIGRAIQEEADRLQERAIQQAVADYEKALRDAVHRAAVRVMDFYSMERIGQDLVIRVKFDGATRAE